MRRIGLYVFITLALVSFATRLSAQEDYKRWTIGLSGVYGDLGNGKGNNGLTFVPSVRYQLAKDWSASGALLLPLATEQSDYAEYYTTGLELGVRRDFEVAPRLRLSLSAVGMWGIIGPYEKVVLCASPYPRESPYWVDLRSQKHRYLVGLRPSVSYQFTSRWSVELGYGFVGYRSSRDIGEVIYVSGKLKGAWGWNDEMGWGNSLRLGVAYSL